MRSSPIEMYSSRYPFGRHRQQQPSQPIEAPSPNQYVLLKRQYHTNDRQELLTKAKYYSELNHGNLIRLLKYNDEAENCCLAVQYQYIANPLREVFGMLSEEELEHGRNGLYHLCSYLISSNINPEVAQQLIGVDGCNQLKLFLDVDFRVINPLQNRTELMRAKRVEINSVMDRYLALCGHTTNCRPAANCLRSQVVTDTNYWLLGNQGATRTCQLNTTFGVPPLKGASVADLLKTRQSVNLQESRSTPKEQKEPSAFAADRVMEQMKTHTFSGIINNYLQLPENSDNKSSKRNTKNKKLSTFAKYERKKISGQSSNSQQSSNDGLPMNSHVYGRRSDASAAYGYELPMCSQMDDAQDRYEQYYQTQQAPVPTEEEQVVYTISVGQYRATQAESEDSDKNSMKNGNLLQVLRPSLRHTADANFYQSPRPEEVQKKLGIRRETAPPLKGYQSQVQQKQPELPFSKKPPEQRKSALDPSTIPYTPPRNNAMMKASYRQSCQINQRVRQSLRKTEQAVARYSQYRRLIN